MKRILITGMTSYVGNSVESWFSKWPEKYSVVRIDLRSKEWKTNSFKDYDTIVHTAGIAHVTYNKKNDNLYREINRDLTYELARKAKADNVKQFVFMSSIIVYGKASLTNGYIDNLTVPQPIDIYGKSKLEAEDLVKTLNNETFTVSIIRSPMIYGSNSKGNFPKIYNLATKTMIFPNYRNLRSMIYIDNLCEYIRLIIDNRISGLHFPQNEEYVSTSSLVSTIASIRQKKIFMVKIFNPIIKITTKINIINKVFGNLYYDKNMSSLGSLKYQIISFEESIRLIEEKLHSFQERGRFK